MKLINTLLLIIIASVTTYAQVPNPVTWTFDIQSKDDGKYEFTAKAEIEGNWAVYSTKIEEGGPIPTSINFSTDLDTKEDIMELSNSIESFDALFDMKLIKFKKEAVFTQIIEPVDSAKSINGNIRFMTCDDSRCLPPTIIEFSLPI